jgi:hypothetical protein
MNHHTIFSRFLFTISLFFSASLLKAQDAVYLKNHWTNNYIGFFIDPYVKNSVQALHLGYPENKTLWYIERVDDTWIRLRDKDGNYLNVEKGFLQASKVPPGFFSAHWKMPLAGAYNLIINRWTGVYLHNQKMEQEASAGNPAWHSAQWSMENKDGSPLLAKDFSLNAYTSLLPNQQQYYKLENVNYDPNTPFLDINKKKSTELAMLPDYGGDNSGKAWKFTMVSDGWYKISNLKLGGTKVLAIAKNTDGSFYFTLTDFANYPNQLWRMIQFKDQSFLNFVAEKKLGIEKFNSMYYTLVSKQHGLEGIKAMKNAEENPRLLAYGFNAGPYVFSPFDLYWRVQPIDDIAVIKNIPLNEAEQMAMIEEINNRTIKLVNEATLKATPISPAPFRAPSGRIKGDFEIYGVGGRDLGTLTQKYEREYTEAQWIYASNRVGKIPMFVYNNTNFNFSVKISYTDENGQAIFKKYAPTAKGSHIEFFLDPMCTYITITATDAESRKEVYRSALYYRSKSVKIFLDGDVNNTRPSFWYWDISYLYD